MNLLERFQNTQSLIRKCRDALNLASRVGFPNDYNPREADPTTTQHQDIYTALKLIFDALKITDLKRNQIIELANYPTAVNSLKTLLGSIGYRLTLASLTQEKLKRLGLAVDFLPNNTEEPPKLSWKDIAALSQEERKRLAFVLQEAPDSQPLQNPLLTGISPQKLRQARLTLNNLVDNFRFGIAVQYLDLELPYNT